MAEHQTSDRDVKKCKRGDYLDLAIGKKPIRIRSNECFRFEMALRPTIYGSPFFYRLYMLGILYKSLGVGPRPTLRPLKQPLYDTVRFSPEQTVVSFNLFTKPVGQAGEDGWSKQVVDTNMMQSSQLGTPTEFDLWGLQAEMNLNSPVSDRIQFLQDTGFKLVFGNRIWCEGPLSLIPCESTLKDPAIRKEYGVKKKRSRGRRIQAK